jgi:hypothetical protein
MGDKQSIEDFIKEFPTGSKIGKWKILDEPSIKTIIYQIKCECSCGSVRYIDLDKIIKNPNIKCLQCFQVGVLLKPNPEIILENEVIKIPLQGKYSHKFVIFDTQDIDLVKDRKWYCKPSVRTCYAKTLISGKFWYAHQILDKSKEILLDHIDNDGLNNRRSNLRCCTINQNSVNKTKARGKSSNYYGVSINKKIGKWRSTLFLDYKQIHHRYFDSEIEAALDHDNIAKQIYGEFAKLNFPDHIKTLDEAITFALERSETTHA